MEFGQGNPRPKRFVSYILLQPALSYDADWMTFDSQRSLSVVSALAPLP